MKGVVVYMDNMLIPGRTKEEQDERLQQVLQFLQNVGLKLNKEKCKIVQMRVYFLGMNSTKRAFTLTQQKWPQSWAW